MTNLNKLLSKACEANVENEIIQSRAALESAIWKPAPSPGIEGGISFVGYAHRSSGIRRTDCVRPT